MHSTAQPISAIYIALSPAPHTSNAPSRAAGLPTAACMPPRTIALRLPACMSMSPHHTRLPNHTRRLHASLQQGWRASATKCIRTTKMHLDVLGFSAPLPLPLTWQLMRRLQNESPALWTSQLHPAALHPTLLSLSALGDLWKPQRVRSACLERRCVFAGPCIFPHGDDRCRTLPTNLRLFVNIELECSLACSWSTTWACCRLQW